MGILQRHEGQFASTADDPGDETIDACFSATDVLQLRTGSNDDRHARVIRIRAIMGRVYWLMTAGLCLAILFFVVAGR